MEMGSSPLPGAGRVSPLGDRRSFFEARLYEIRLSRGKWRRDKSWSGEAVLRLARLNRKPRHLLTLHPPLLP